MKKLDREEGAVRSSRLMKRKKQQLLLKMAEAASDSPASADISQEFDFETRFVVLSFLGLVPSNILEQSFSSRGTSSGDSHVSGQGRLHHGGDSLAELPKDTLSRKVNRLGSTDDEGEDTIDYSSVMDNGFHDTYRERGDHNGSGLRSEDVVDTSTPTGEISQTLNEHLKKQCAHYELDNLRHSSNSSKEAREHQQNPNRNKLQKHSSFDIKPDSALTKHNSEGDGGVQRRRIAKGHSIYMSPQRPNHIPVRSFLSVDASGEGVKHGTERVSPGRQFLRRDSDVSDGSEITVSVQSSRSSYIDVQSVDLEPLVKSNLINPHMVPLKEELMLEKHELEESYQKAKFQSPHLAHRSGPNTPLSDMSPEQAVAQYLCVLGDQVQERYSNMLNTAFQSVITRPLEDLTYGDLQAATQDMTGQTSGWTKIALVMMLSKQLTYNVLKTGGKGIGKVTDFTARLIEDTAATFIISKGGWHGITELELETPCTPSDIYMKFPYVTDEGLNLIPKGEEEGLATITGTPADHTSSTTLDNPSDHDEQEELPVDTPVQTKGSEERKISRTRTLSDQSMTSGDQIDAGYLVDGGNYDTFMDESKVEFESGEESPKLNRTIEEEAEDNVARIRPQINFWRQKSGEYSQYLEEEKRRYEHEQRIWRRWTYGTFGGLSAAFIALMMYRLSRS